MSRVHRRVMCMRDAEERKSQQQREAGGEKQRKTVLLYSVRTIHREGS